MPLLRPPSNTPLQHCHERHFKNSQLPPPKRRTAQIGIIQSARLQRAPLTALKSFVARRGVPPPITRKTTLPPLPRRVRPLQHTNNRPRWPANAIILYGITASPRHSPASLYRHRRVAF